MVASARGRRAFVVYLRPGYPQQNALPEAIRTNELILGWSEAQGLLNLKLRWDTFRQIIKETYELNTRQAGAQAGSLWIFIREMGIGDLVVVPHGEQFYLAEVCGDPYYRLHKVAEERSYRRPVKWLRNYEPISKTAASSRLRKALRANKTCTECSNPQLVAEIESLTAEP